MVSQGLVSPQTDKLQYRELHLNNGLRVILVSDRTSEKAAAAVNVRVGSLSDPKEFLGLAHFLEHMLFYASERYPVEDEYMKFVADHGGSTNAFTTAEDTNFYFDINAGHLEAALDRFAQFFTAPLISKDGVEREVNAVDSEHGKNLNSDAWRRGQLWRHVSNPEHPFSHFHTGSLDTLLTQPLAKGLDPHKAVLDFYRKHYCASVMTCCIYGRQPLDELAELARSKFEPVPNRSISAPTFSGDVWQEEHRGQLLKVVPVREGHTVELHWTIPAQQPQWRCRPAEYLSHLLGHEGGGSLLSELKRRGWATELVAGEGSGSFSGRSIFMAHITLTDAGQEAAADALALVFAYIQMLRTEKGVTAERFREVQALREMKFNFADRPSPQGYAQGIASTMQLVPGPYTLLALHNVPLEYDEAAIYEVLDELRPEGVQCMWCSTSFVGKTDQREPWYGTQYARSAISADWLGKWRDATCGALHLPRLNPFIPTNFDMLQDESPAQEPTIVLETPLTTCWHRLNTSFDLPKVVLRLLLTSPAVYAVYVNLSPEAAVQGRLLVDIMTDQLNEVTYDAQLAGLYANVSHGTDGITLQFSGYNDKMLPFVQMILQHLVSFQAEADLFQIRREALQKRYNNIKFMQPYQLASDACETMVELRRWPWQELLHVVPFISADDVQAFHRDLLRRCHLQWHITGNITQDTAVSTAQQAEQLLSVKAGTRPSFASERLEQRVVQVPAGQPALLSQPGPNPENNNSAIFLYFQVGQDDIERIALANLLATCAGQEAFTQLRTHEQLGYTVFLGRWRHLTMHSLALVIQSNVHGAAHLEARAEAFLRSYHKQLSGMDAATFADQVENLAQQQLEAPKYLRHQAQREWREIHDGTLRFDRVQQEVAALRALTHDQLLAFFQDTLAQEDRRKKVSLYVSADQPAAESPNSTADSTDENTALAKIQAAQASTTGVLSNGSQHANDAAASGANKCISTTPSDNNAKCHNDPAANLNGGPSLPSPAPAISAVADIWAWKRKQVIAPSLR